MSKKIYIPLPRNISVSVFEALKLHESYFEGLGYEVKYLSRSKKIKDKRVFAVKSVFKTIKMLRSKDSGKIYCITVKEVLIGSLSNILAPKKEIIFWVQGLIDDEDLLSNNNKIRYYVFKNILKICLRISTKLVVVTHQMFEVLKDSYSCPKSKLHIVIPCKSRVAYNGKEKTNNSLCYIGGLSKWQNVDKILKFYNQLSAINSNYKLFIATFNHDAANILIENMVDKNYQTNITLVNVSSTSEVQAFLSKMEYGFLIRDNIPLNNVASPIKLAEYLSCGVTPIISTSLIEFYQELRHWNCGVFIDNDFNLAIKNLLQNYPSPKKALDAYNNIYKPNNFEDQLNIFLNK
ncbi:Glycosyltransferase involved in cell wall bisynthesis [Hyunsoonleella jejuensis]|uniref:Glycosyltransferase involved in cell wall bisynthesis n=1 Tax=Hyunsoonleella jejuensis TaxID=419940 RepID=A0A1H9AZA8_9FLAO|nr:glycosyltransferase [Hyunsoonleella jejuensis]SEP82096.1 Glycosyltransferase involved in cell wall bisynthesis [Hyunsoonleella jejuensis]